MSLLFGWGCVLAERVGSAVEVDPAALAENNKDALAHNAALRSGSRKHQSEDGPEDDLEAGTAVERRSSKGFSVSRLDPQQRSELRKLRVLDASRIPERAVVSKPLRRPGRYSLAIQDVHEIHSPLSGMRVSFGPPAVETTVMSAAVAAGATSPSGDGAASGSEPASPVSPGSQGSGKKSIKDSRKSRTKSSTKDLYTLSRYSAKASSLERRSSTASTKNPGRRSSEGSSATSPSTRASIHSVVEEVSVPLPGVVDEGSVPSDELSTRASDEESRESLEEILASLEKQWGHGGRPGKGVWKQPKKLHEEHAEAVSNSVLCCIYCNNRDPRVCVLRRKGLCVLNLSTMGGKLIVGALVCAAVLGMLVSRTQSMHLSDESPALP